VKCNDLYRRLSDHAEGLLDEGDCAAIETHLRECSPCNDLRKDLETLSRLCRETTRPRMPDDVRQRIEKLLRPPA
jgi:predicted anti-sigma-YlaC factor YlaD